MGKSSTDADAASDAPLKQINFRVWFWSFAATLLVVVVLVRTMPNTGPWTWLVLYWVYMSLACTFLPLPTLWICLWLGSIYSALLVAFIGALGTCVANLHDYYLLRFFLCYDRVARAKESRLYERAESWFRRFPFVALSVASFLPIPVDVVRLLAIASGYSRIGFVLASFAGRFPRYLAIAWLGHALKPSSSVIALVLVFSVLMGLAKVLPGCARKLKKKKDATCVSQD